MTREDQLRTEWGTAEERLARIQNDRKSLQSAPGRLLSHEESHLLRALQKEEDSVSAEMSRITTAAREEGIPFL